MASIHVSKISSILAVEKQYTTFPTVDDQHNIFFERSNKQILSCTNEKNFLTISVKCLDNTEKAVFKLPPLNDPQILSIKLSPNNKIIAVQKLVNIVEFSFETKEHQLITIPQETKSKTACIQGFFWITNEDVVYVTSSGIEIYRISREKKKTRLSSEISVLVNWYLWHSTTSIVVLASGPNATIIQCYKFVNKYSLVKQKKLCLDDLVKENKSKGRSEPIDKADCNVYFIYGVMYFGVMTLVESKNKRWQSDLIMFEVTQHFKPKKFVLTTDYGGGLDVNVVDNLIVLHHKPTKTSAIFDIKQECMPSKDEPDTFYLRPLLTPCSICMNDLPLLKNLPRDTSFYDHDWLCFQPNVLINGSIGVALHLKCCLAPAEKMITDKLKLATFLFYRSDAKLHLLKVIRNALLPGPTQASLLEFRSIFQLIHKESTDVDHSIAISVLSGSLHASARSCILNFTEVVQADMYSEVFTVFNERKDISSRFKMAVLVEYILVLNQRDIPPEHFICELLINILVTEKKFYQLHQFIQYHVVPDSKPIACLLLSLESTYPPGFQLGLDMLLRLETHEEIVEVLLSKRFVIPALKYIRSEKKIDNIPAKKYLEIARGMSPKSIFFAVFKLFEARNHLNNGTSYFTKEENCEGMVTHFITNFGEENLSTDRPFVPFNEQLEKSLMNSFTSRLI